MAGPYDYTIDVANPFQAALQGYGVGATIRENQLKLQQQEAAQQQAQRQQELLGRLASNPNASADDYASVMTQIPALSENLTRAWTLKNDAQQQSQAADLLKWGAAVKSGQILYTGRSQLFSLIQTIADMVMDEIPVSSFIATLLDDPDAATARATLGAATAGAVGSSGLNMTTARMLGRTTGSTGPIEELTSAQGRAFVAAVGLAGNETIAGIKTFSSAPAFPAGATVGTAPMGVPAGNAPLYPCRAWCRFNGAATGTNPPIVGGNIATVQRVSTGIYTLTFAVPLHTAGYAVHPLPSNNVSPTTIITFAGSDPTVSAFTIACVNAAGTPVDPAFVSLSVIC